MHACSFIKVLNMTVSQGTINDLVFLRKCCLSLSKCILTKHHNYNTIAIYKTCMYVHRHSRLAIASRINRNNS